MSETSFDRVISEHLALCARNRRLEPRMPLEGYREPGSGPPEEREPETAAEASEKPWLDTESFWDTSGERPLPEFDWGDE
jgi:hypothetical protein